MRRPLPKSRWFVALLLSLLAFPAHATLIQRMSEAELVAAARWIVTGRVTSVSGAWNADHTQIFTTIEIEPAEVLKGDLPKGPLRLRLLGGSADGISMIVVGAPVFTRDEEVVLCLGADRGGAFPVVGLGQGKFTLVRDGVSGLLRVKETGEPRAAFLARLRERVGR